MSEIDQAENLPLEMEKSWVSTFIMLNFEHSLKQEIEFVGVKNEGM